MMNHISFKPFTRNYLSKYYEWSEKDHVKNTWFLEGYEPRDYVLKKIEGNGYDYPFVILLDDSPIGYIVYCDLYAYKTLCPDPKGVFTDEPKGTFCVDLFIGEEEYLGKGFGTKIMKAFCQMLFENPEVKRLVIDPSLRNKRAIRCYEKVGFHLLHEAHDGTSDVLLMEMQSPN